MVQAVSYNIDFKAVIKNETYLCTIQGNIFWLLKSINLVQYTVNDLHMKSVKEDKILLSKSNVLHLDYEIMNIK